MGEFRVSGNGWNMWGAEVCLGGRWGGVSPHFAVSPFGVCVCDDKFISLHFKEDVKTGRRGGRGGEGILSVL